MAKSFVSNPARLAESTGPFMVACLKQKGVFSLLFIKQIAYSHISKERKLNL